MLPSRNSSLLTTEVADSRISRKSFDEVPESFLRRFSRSKVIVGCVGFDGLKSSGTMLRSIFYDVVG